MLLEVGLFDSLDTSSDYDSILNESSFNRVEDQSGEYYNDKETRDYYLEGTSITLNQNTTTHINTAESYEWLSVETFETELFRFNREGDNRKAMYLIHRQFIQWKREKNLAACDLLFKHLDIYQLDIQILICILMASFQIKSRLSYRADFFTKVIEKATLIFSEKELRQIFSNLR